MPSNGLTIGGGAARGVKAFMQSFTQAKRFEHEEKLQKNAVIVELLSKQLEDPNTTYKDRANIMRSIPRLYGMKDDAIEPLMRMLDASNEENIQTEPAQQGKVGTPVTTLKDPNAVGEVTVGGAGELSTTTRLNPNISQRGTQATSDIPALVQKKGELTPAKLRSLLVIQQNKAVDEADVEKQTKLLKVQYTLQNEIFGKGGYTEKLPYTFDADKNLIMRWRRPTDGDIQTRNMGKVTTEAIEKANIAADAPKGRFGAIQQANQIVSAYESDPTSYPEWQYKAAKSLLDELEKHGQVQDAQIKALTQNIYGNPPKPITPAQSVDDRARSDAQRLTIQKDIDDSTAEMNAAKSRMDALEARKELAAQESTNAEAKFSKTDYTESDPEYSKLKSDAEQARFRYDTIEKEYNQASQAEVLAKNKLSGAQNRLKGFSDGTNTMTPVLKSAVDQVRKNNPTQTANMTDEQIINYLRSKGLIK